MQKEWCEANGAYSRNTWAVCAAGVGAEDGLVKVIVLVAGGVAAAVGLGKKGVFL